MKAPTASASQSECWSLMARTLSLSDVVPRKTSIRSLRSSRKRTACALGSDSRTEVWKRWHTVTLGMRTISPTDGSGPPLGESHHANEKVVLRPLAARMAGTSIHCALGHAVRPCSVHAVAAPMLAALMVRIGRPRR